MQLRNETWDSPWEFPWTDTGTFLPSPMLPMRVRFQATGGCSLLTLFSWASLQLLDPSRALRIPNFCLHNMRSLRVPKFDLRWHAFILLPARCLYQHILKVSPFCNLKMHVLLVITEALGSCSLMSGELVQRPSRKVNGYIDIRIPRNMIAYEKNSKLMMPEQRSKATRRIYIETNTVPQNTTDVHQAFSKFQSGHVTHLILPLRGAITIAVSAWARIGMFHEISGAQFP